MIRLATYTDTPRPCPKPEPRAKKERKPIKKVSDKRKGGSGELLMFQVIAKTRPNICFVTGEKVNVWKNKNELDVRCFAHVVSKGSRPDLRLLDRNIVIVQPIVHDVYDRGNDKERADMEQYPGWFELLELHDKILEENNRDKK